MTRLVAALLLAAILCGAVFYNIQARQEPARPPAAARAGLALEEALPVTVAEVRGGGAAEALALIGTLRSDREAAITAKAPGRIAAVLARQGTRVRRGQPLVRLDVGGAAAALRGARAAIAAALAQQRRAEDGRRARIVEMDARVSEAAAGLRTAEARLRQAEAAGALAGSAGEADAERAEASVKQAEAGAAQARSGLEQAQRTLERAELLYSKGGAARAEVEGARTQVDIAKSQRDAAEAGLRQALAAARPAAASVGLRSRVSQADIEAARAGVAQAEEGLANVRRARVEAMRIAASDIAAARAAVEQARAGLEQVQSQVGSGVIATPIDGVVATVAANVGEIAQRGMPLMTVVGAGSVYLQVSAPDRAAGRLHAGQRAVVTLDTAPGRPLTGIVGEKLPPAAGERGVPVRIRLSGAGVPLQASAGARATITLPAPSARPMVPLSAVRSEGGERYVFVVEDGFARRRRIEIGASAGDRVEVAAGLRSGEAVIVAGPLAVKDGAPVRAGSSP